MPHYTIRLMEEQDTREIVEWRYEAPLSRQGSS